METVNIFFCESILVWIIGDYPALAPRTLHRSYNCAENLVESRILARRSTIPVQ